MLPSIKIHLQWGKKGSSGPPRRKHFPLNPEFFNLLFPSMGLSHSTNMSKVVCNVIWIFKFEPHLTYARKLAKDSYKELLYKVNNFFPISPHPPPHTHLHSSHLVCVEEGSLGDKSGLLKIRVSLKISLPDTKQSWGTQYSVELVISCKFARMLMQICRICYFL